MTDSGMQGDNRSITIEKDAISSAIISGNGNKVVIYQYQSERLIEPEETQVPGEIGPNPYKGLLAFQEEDGDRFFGREAQIEKLWNLFRALHENMTQPEAPLRLLPILGPSGSGKSSLARAGLIPELARRSLPGYSLARVAVLVPGTHPVEALATVLARVATNDQTPVEKTKEFERVLKGTSNTTTDTIIYDGLRRIANVLPEIAVSPLVVLVDQFEEVYSLCKDTTERQIFIENLIHAASDRSGCVSVIITLRSDFLGETQRHPALNQVIASKGVIVPAMSEEELRRAITKPAENAGHPLDEAVVTLLLKDTDGREGALPLLQFALTRIWEGLKKGVEPVKTLRDIGGVGGALAQEAERIFDSLNDEEQKIARRVFLGLVQLGEGASDTRRRANVDNLVSYKEQPESVKRVIDRFAHPGVRLVTVSSEKGIETAEVTHEALFANWGKMKQWLDSSRSDIRFGRRLEAAAVEWKQKNKSKGYLLQGKQLQDAQVFHKQQNPNLTLSHLASDFIQKSVNYRRNYYLRLIGFVFIPIILFTISAERQMRISRYWSIYNTAKVQKDSSSKILALQELVKLGVDLSNVNLRNVDLTGINFSGASLNGVNLSGASLNGGNLSNADLSRANLSNANLRGTKLNKTNFTGATMNDTDLSAADLSDAQLEAAIISDVNLENANLNRTNFKNAQINSAKLNDEYLDNALLCATTMFDGKISNRDCLDINTITSSANTNIRPPINSQVCIPGHNGKEVQKSLAITLAKALEIAKCKNQGLSPKIGLEVTLCYYDLQEAKELVRVAESSVNYARAILRDAQALEEAGVGTRFDVLKSQVNLATGNQALINARTKEKIAKIRLSFQLGFPDSVTLLKVDPVKLGGLWNLPLEKIIDLAQKNRKKQQKQHNQIKLEVQEIFISLQSSFDIVQSSNASLVQNRESLRIARLRFQAGVGTQKDVIESEEKLTISERNQIKSIINYNRALAQLKRALSPDN
ncbi:pentapeptide repeat-containing protein [Rivularia sp. UHCC 0363]|uniref:nSTAND1 domain-containing NTPase n=1 Tax=Rivularia sp. UHCC 0363 TaxID=3110244 RepID=UPI002B2003DF|nr:pentapeptide repeat-containing protein [Rivularia sp. UHCC 0363]MEA5595784.1 pentapeptide repeat-containing protein [Rivularia sp. UHCC 0363]